MSQHSFTAQGAIFIHSRWFVSSFVLPIVTIASAAEKHIYDSGSGGTHIGELTAVIHLYFSIRLQLIINNCFKAYLVPLQMEFLCWTEREY